MSNERIEATINLNGAELCYEIEGAGEPLLLLHGGTGCHNDWVYAGREHCSRIPSIAPDARGHGRSTNPEKTITHRQCALDTLALLDHLAIERCKAIGVSMGGNILLHMATMEPERVKAMVVVSTTMYFPDQARADHGRGPHRKTSRFGMGAMRKRHDLGDEQILRLVGMDPLAQRQLRRHEFHADGSVSNQSSHADRAGRPRPAISGGDGGRDVSRHSAFRALDRPKRRSRSDLLRCSTPIHPDGASLPAGLTLTALALLTSGEQCNDDEHEGGCSPVNQNHRGECPCCMPEDDQPIENRNQGQYANRAGQRLAIAKTQQ